MNGLLSRFKSSYAMSFKCSVAALRLMTIFLACIAHELIYEMKIRQFEAFIL